MTLPTQAQLVADVIAISSILSILLPPIETFSPYPRFQKFYAVLVMIITRWTSLNLRNTIYWQKFDNTRKQETSLASGAGASSPESSPKPQ